MKARKEFDLQNNKDVKMYDFISQSNYENQYLQIKKIAEEFSEFTGEDPKYNTPVGIGMCLSRLKLILDRKKLGTRRAVKVDVQKAKQKLLMFKEPEDVDTNVDFSKSGVKEELESE